MKAQNSNRLAIVTKYVGATNYSGPRIVAKSTPGAKTWQYDHALSEKENHAQACVEFCKEWGWEGDRIGGEMPDGTFVWVEQV